MLADIKVRNPTFLGYGSNEIKMFQRPKQTPDVMRELLAGFVEQAEKLHDEKLDDLVGLPQAMRFQLMCASNPKRLNCLSLKISSVRTCIPLMPLPLMARLSSRA